MEYFDNKLHIYVIICDLKLFIITKYFIKDHKSELVFRLIQMMKYIFSKFSYKTNSKYTDCIGKLIVKYEA